MTVTSIIGCRLYCHDERFEMHRCEHRAMGSLSQLTVDFADDEKKGSLHDNVERVLRLETKNTMTVEEDEDISC